MMQVKQQLAGAAPSGGDKGAEAGLSTPHSCTQTQCMCASRQGDAGWNDSWLSSAAKHLVGVAGS